MKNLKRGIAGLAGLWISLFLFHRQYAIAIVTKAAGGDSPCPWGKLLAVPWDVSRFVELQDATASQVKLLEEDRSLGIRKYATPTRSFWLKSEGELMGAGKLLSYVLAEQAWLYGLAPDRAVRPGDVVMDVGAHVGTFGDEALRRGASKVIMVEPDPVNQECIRRNFKDEIAEGRVILVTEGAWSKTDTLEFHIGVANSGTGSLVVQESGSKIVKVAVRPIDSMMEELGLEKLDFMKMDIEGAEREALKGASKTLHRWKPRIMLDAYHLKDDDVVLPPLIRQANPAYRAWCAACSTSRHDDDKRLIPYAIFFE
ncbi:MAG: FkbM family methyltransferase [Acidobacteria bacterium]|nr:FkbM family methyltransferase [Acidobacteriota bacterium]